MSSLYHSLTNEVFLPGCIFIFTIFKSTYLRIKFELIKLKSKFSKSCPRIGQRKVTMSPLQIQLLSLEEIHLPDPPTSPLQQNQWGLVFSLPLLTIRMAFFWEHCREIRQTLASVNLWISVESGVDGIKNEFLLLV